MKADGTIEESSGGVVRMWLDQEFLFTLRMEMPLGPDEGTFEMRVVEIEFNGELSDDLFRFEPPEGAIEVAGSDVTNTRRTRSDSGPGRLQLAQGFLTPGYFPAGYRVVSSETKSDQSGRSVEAVFTLKERDGDGYIMVWELVRPGLPEALRHGRRIVIGGHDAWLNVDSGEISLAWEQESLVLYVIASGVEEDEVIHMAESMRLPEPEEIP